MLRVLIVLLAGVAIMTVACAQTRQPADEPLLNWSSWEKYGRAIKHPASILKRSDLERAAENRKRYAWAQSYAAGVEGNAKVALAKITPEYLAQMIPADTPGDTLFTPCPACRDQGKPVLSHGQYSWSNADPERMTCTVCKTVYPNEKYPEDLVFKTKYGGGQTISFYGGEPFNLFGFNTRPSFSGNLRARKVAYAANLCRTLAEGYASTGNAAYARGARQMLLRFAEIYPTWLVHVGYGEYADMEPHLAALNINALPEDEITPTPKGPDRKLHSGYWQGGRATGTGMEAGFVRQMVEAYDFTCDAQDGGKAIFSDADKLKIEKDLLLESTVLLVADKSVNNKSVGNATAVSLVGMALGHPEMVRFGLDVFMKTVDGWFLPDGSTSESFSYAAMTLGGIEALGQAFRGYSDPVGYKDAEGKRIEKFDLYHDTSYKKVWQAMFNGLQGDLRYPPLADGHKTQGLGAHFAELMADNYPDNPQYVALLREYAGQDLSGGDRRTAFYGRPPGLEQRPAEPFTLPDYVYPVLQMGYLRSGDTGRDSALVLSASDWGGHHHIDSLSLYYWQALGGQGTELLSDLGYLWDHPMSMMTRRTFAHNTVMVDGAEQAMKGRGGKFTLFSPQRKIKVMEAESQAYPQASLYRRTVAQISHEPGRQYVLDIFRVQGGKTHDYIFHGINNDLQVSAPELTAANEKLDLANQRSSTAVAPWQLTWKLDDKSQFSALWANEDGYTSLIGDGWGQRDFRNSDVGAKLPYIVRRHFATTEPSVFIGAFEGFENGRALVKSVRRLSVPEAEKSNAVAVAVETVDGTDYVISCLEAKPLQIETPAGRLEVNARFAAISVKNGQIVSANLVEGTVLKLNGQTVAGQ
ncbi:MAG: heparinase II/III domain-containing protein [Armatimonadota bacterium]